MTKKFFVGKGKKVGEKKVPDDAVPATGQRIVEAVQASRRFLVGKGEKIAPIPKPIVVTHYPVTASATMPEDDRLPGCICRYPFRVGHVPDCRYFDGALFVCETADLKTMQQLAQSGNTTVADLEWRRHGFVGDFGCPDAITAPDPRRRCPSCPFWNRTTDVPFQLSYEDVKP